MTYYLMVKHCLLQTVENKMIKIDAIARIVLEA